jgi:type VI secretion system secreted protein VgrG
MEHNVIAEIEIEDTKIEYYTSVILRQKFNDHHEFIIRINHDVLEVNKSFSIGKAQNLIGKSTIIRLKKIADVDEVTYEFRGIVCEIKLEQSDGFSGDLVLRGYSPTIMLENGAHLTSFYKKNLKKIAEQVTKSISQSYCTVNLNNQYKPDITYICQYKESNFHFLNRLSAEFSEWFYYDGKTLNFGKPSSLKNIDITYGEDVSSIQLTLRVLPMTFTNYSYNSKEDKVISFDAPAQVDGLDQYASYVLKESNKLFSEAVNMPVRQRVENKNDLENFIKKQKASLAADLEVLTGTSSNPAINIGVVVNVRISKFEDNEFKKDDYGKFIVIDVEHRVGDNGKYYNSFQALPAGIEAIPVKNIVLPLGEPQIATVKDNKDPDNMGRVRAQMLWQKDDEMTDWLRVMTPDAGGGKDSAKNRGLVCVPETGDQVLICFRYNDPDRPFVLGSLFHGKTGGGGSEGNKVKSLTALSGSTVTMNAKTVSIIDADAKSKIYFDGTGKVDVFSTESITLTCGDSSVSLKKDGTIEIKGKGISLSGKTVNTTGSDNAVMSSGGASFSADGKKNEANMNGTKATVNGDTETTLNSGAKTTVSAGGKVAIQGAIVALN